MHATEPRRWVRAGPCVPGQGAGLAVSRGQVVEYLELLRLSLQAVSHKTSLSPAANGAWSRGVGAGRQPCQSNPGIYLNSHPPALDGRLTSLLKS